MPPSWLIRTAVAAVWAYEGLWCKLLGRTPHQVAVVETVPRLGPRIGRSFLRVLGVVEVAIAVWVLSGVEPRACALTQTLLLASLNTCGVCFARQILHDAPGMLIKNAAFLVLAWVAATLPGSTAP